MKKILLLSGLLLTLSTGAIAQDINDPLEPVNRAIFGFNNVVDKVILDPAVIAYRAAVPKPARTGLKNFLHNLKSPIFFANNILQGDIDGAATTLQRTLINTFVGFGGIFDFAAAEGIQPNTEDFGQTLAVWGVGDGAYLVLPILGPSNVRDLGGRIVDGYADPIDNYLDNIDEDEWRYAKAAAEGFVAKNEVFDLQQDIKRHSSDYYAAVRSAASQARASAIKDQTVKRRGPDGSLQSSNISLPNFDFE